MLVSASGSNLSCPEGSSVDIRLSLHVQSWSLVRIDRVAFIGKILRHTVIFESRSEILREDRNRQCLGLQIAHYHDEEWQIADSRSTVVNRISRNNFFRLGRHAEGE